MQSEFEETLIPQNSHTDDTMFTESQDIGHTSNDYNVVEKDTSRTYDVASIAKQLRVTSNVAMQMKARTNLIERIGSRKTKFKEQMRQLSEKRLTIKQIFGRYVKTSTLHGFRYTFMDTFPIRRIIWAALMVIGAVYFFFKLRDGVVEYYNFPYSTKTTIENVESLDFPTISLCPINQYNESKVVNSHLNQLYKEDRLPLYKNWSKPDYDIDGEHLVGDIMATSFKIDDLFMDCDYIQQDTDNPNVGYRYCGPSNFSTYISEKGQVCFTLNSAKHGHEVMRIDRAGIKNGFELHLDLRNNDAIKLFPYTGMEVIFHDSAEPPTSATGFFITTGLKTYVELKKTQTENLPPMFSTLCGITKLKYHKVYNQKACLLEKLTDYIAHKCRCRDLFMPDNGLPFCSLVQISACVFPAKESFDEQKAIRGCPLDCKVTSYESKRTETRFLHNPESGFEPALIRKNLWRKHKNHSHLLHLHESMSIKELDRYIEQNVLVVIFYYKEMEITSNIHQAAFTFYNFLGGAGGAFQLMLGASLLTFFEFIDLFTLLIYNQLLRVNRKKSGKDIIELKNLLPSRREGSTRKK